MVKGARGVTTLRLAFHARDNEATVFERGLEAHGGCLIGNVELLELLAVDCDEAGGEEFVLTGGKLGDLATSILAS